MLAQQLSLNFLQIFIFGYLLLISLITFFYFGYDKWISGTSQRRVSEKMLWFLALIGGSAGALVGMHVFRHKTKKLSFEAVLAVILTVQVWIVFWMFGKI